jgi:hypothetical protein
MFNHPSVLTALAPTGDPTPEALHREEYYNRAEAFAARKTAPARDHRAPARARFLRAQVAAKVGQFF